MELTFLNKVLEGSYAEKDIARVFAEALDQTVYNMILKDFISRTGLDMNELIAKAKLTMMEDFKRSVQESEAEVSEETITRFENGIQMGALQVRDNLGLENML